MAKTSVRKKTSAAASVKTTPLVLADELRSHCGMFKVGIMTLNSEKTMNAVDLSMVNLIDEILTRWQQDETIVAVVMRGAGDKAFCAGGDIRQLYNSMQAEGDEHVQYADAFFTGEYSKNYRVHRFGKPLIAWGHGFVMGGGLGLYIGASHKVGTQTLKLAWPEIRIGLFPDVAGSYYLSRLEFPLGHWMGLTGSQMNAADCKHAGLINYCIGHEDFDALIEQLLAQPWQANKAMNNQYVRQLLTSLERDTQIEFPESNVAENRHDIEKIFSAVSPCDSNFAVSDCFTNNKKALKDISLAMASCDNDATITPWLAQGIDNFNAGCPATAHLIMKQLQKGKNMTLKEVVQWELAMALQSVRHPDFAEGIRALVVDKDFNPQWRHRTVEAVPETWVNALMKPLWPLDEHPFRDL